MKRTLVGFGIALTLAIGLASSAQARMFACDDDSGLCLEPTKGANWAPDSQTSAKDRKKQSKSSPGRLSLDIDGGRGSLFVNGRYAGTAPLDGIEVPSGPNDLQVRDGAEVLASGVLTVPKDGDLSITVRGAG